MAVTTTATVAACSQTVSGTAQRSNPGVPDPNRSYGYVDDRCGLLDDTSVQATLDADDVTRPYSGAVCQYVLSRKSGSAPATTIDVTFSWFETGRLERERELVAARGAVVTDIVVERHDAFSRPSGHHGGRLLGHGVRGNGRVELVGAVPRSVHRGSVRRRREAAVGDAAFGYVT